MRRVAIIGNQGDTLINFRGALIKELVRRGAKVFALVPALSLEDARRIRELGAEPVSFDLDRVGINPVRDLVDTIKLAVKLRRLKVDLTLSYFAKPVIYGTVAAILAGVSTRFAMIEGLGYAFIETGAMSMRRRIVKKALVFLYKVALKRNKGVFFLNPDDSSEFVSRGFVSKEAVISLTGIGVDLDEFQYHEPRKERPVFILVARLLVEKGVREFVEAARLIKSRNPEVRFVILGGLDANPTALSEREVLGWVEERVVEWPGAVTDVRPWIRESSVFVLPSYREGLPRSTQEAMAIGRAVLTTDAPGCRETVVHGINGFLVPVRDSSQLADRMMQLLCNPNLIVSMGRQSRAIAEKKFNVKKINAQICDTLGIDLADEADEVPVAGVLEACDAGDVR